MKTKAVVLLSLAAILMLLPVSGAVNTQSVNSHSADGSSQPPPPFPPLTTGIPA
ncbi:MAG TPA: hypothetical protein VEN79_13690 [Terriglobia bacterium]|nr:hypothetical protein [Terriglobia bacterium]